MMLVIAGYAASAEWVHQDPVTLLVVLVDLDERVRSAEPFLMANMKGYSMHLALIGCVLPDRPVGLPAADDPMHFSAVNLNSFIKPFAIFSVHLPHIKIATRFNQNFSLHLLPVFFVEFDGA